MYLQLVRPEADETKPATEGKLFINGTYECFTLEDTDRQLENGGTKVYGKTAIPRGIYDIVISYSPRFKQNMPEILNVPQFEGIRLHWGNYSKDTEGCPLVGDTNDKTDDDFIGQSKKAYTRILAKLEEADSAGEKITIEIV